ncbi:MAG: isochorismatase family protein [Acidobacteria bacterium]|nr:isochorismatase family protein [Acidobacteriota bacterium]
MPLTQFDTKAALIVIDLQKGIAGLPGLKDAGEVVARSARLAAAFRERGQTVVLVNVTAPAPGRTDVGMRTFAFPPDWAELVAEMQPESGDVLISKQRRGAFLGTGPHEALQERGVTQVFMVGIATSAGVESTARSADDYGYNVVFVVDAMTDRDAEVHRFCVEKIFPKIGETATTEDVLGRI